MRGALGLLILVTLVVLCADSTAFGQADSKFAIIPGKGIGPVHVGMSISQVTAILGPGEQEPEHPGGAVVYRWFKKVAPDAYSGLYVISLEGRVTLVVAFYAPQYVTANGLHTGVTERVVRNAMGEPSHVSRTDVGRILQYPGIRFQLVEDPGLRGYLTVSQIMVSR